MTDAAGDRLDFSAWSTRLYVWGDRARRFNSTRLSIVAIVGGLAGLALSITAGTAMTWLVVGIAIAAVFLAMLIVSGNGGRLHTVTPLQWVALALAPFFNQIAFVAPGVYVFHGRWRADRPAAPAAPARSGVAVLAPLTRDALTLNETINAST